MNNNIFTFKLILILIVCISLVVIPMVNSISLIYAQNNVIDKALKIAEEKWTDGRFDEAIVIIKKTLESKEINLEQEQKALRLLGLVYISQDYLTEAKISIKKLLELVPNYKPDPIYDPPAFRNLVETVKEETVVTPVKEPEKSGSKKWWYIGGSVGVAAILAIIFWPDDPPPPPIIQGPPDFPSE